MKRARTFRALGAENRRLRHELAKLRASLASASDAARQFGAFIETTSALAWLKDSRLRFTYVNPAFEKFHGLSLAQVAGHTAARLMEPRYARFLNSQDRAVLQRRKIIRAVQSVPGAGGAMRDWRVMKFPFRDARGRWYVGGLALDITEHTTISAALEKANRYTTNILDHVTDGFVAFDQDWRFRFINRYAAGVIGRLHKHPGKLLGLGLWEKFPDLAGTRLEDQFRRAARQRKPVAFEFFYPPLNGWFFLRAYPSDEGVVVYFHEITERKRAEEILRGLHGRVLAVQESERRRVARELHDGVNQLLSLAQFRLQGIRHSVAPENPPAARNVAITAGLLGRAVREVRRISQNLRPGELDHLGLLPAIHEACARFEQRCGVSVRLRCPPSFPVLAPEIKLTLYRIVQEALNNVEKHAAANSVALALTHRRGEVALSVQDDGLGFAEETLKRPPARRGHFGLISMRERAALQGGMLTVQSRPGTGTTVFARLPLDGAAEHLPKVRAARRKPSRSKSRS